MNPPVSPRVLRAWRQSIYRAGPVSARIGRRSASLDAALAAWGAREAAFITPWNPLGRRMPEGWNRRIMRQFLAYLRRHSYRRGAGGARDEHGAWQEEHVLLAADHRRIVVIGRRFRQLGIVAARRGQAVRIRFLSSAGSSPRV